MILVVDHGQGNIGSLKNSIQQIGKEYKLCDNYENMDWGLNIDGFILPGVGSFDQCMVEMRKRSLERLIYTFVDKGIKGMGICLGMQILCETSEEGGNEAGLGIIKGKVKRLNNEKEKVPNMGWNKTYCRDRVDDDKIKSLCLEGEYYYVHSYAVETSKEENEIGYFYHGGEPKTACIYGRNILGLQFHPEKSQSKGLKLIKDYFN